MLKKIFQSRIAKNLFWFDFWGGKRKFFVMVGVLIVILLSLFRFAEFKHAPDLSIEELIKCDNYRIKAYGHYVITKTGVCIQEEECRLLSSIIDCKDLDDPRGGWKVAKGLSKNNFDFERVCIDEENHNIVYIRNAGVDYSTVCHPKNEAWFFDIKDETYFWRPYKGNGRLFEVDKETFKYLGEDRYEDKDGIIVKNSRIN